MRPPSRRLLLLAVVPVIAAGTAWYWRDLLYGRASRYLLPLVVVEKELHLAY